MSEKTVSAAGLLQEQFDEIKALNAQLQSALSATVEQRENAQRSVETLKMVLDLAVEALPGEHPYGDVPGAIKDLAEQRDRLLEALKLCEGNISSLLAADHPRVYSEWLQAVRNSIASIERQEGEVK